MKAQHQKTPLLDTDFPMNIFFTDVTEFPPHWHEVVEVIYVPEGSLKVGVNSDIFTLNARDILLISGGDVHYFLPQPKQVNRLILHFELSVFESMIPSARNKRFSLALLPFGEGCCPVHILLEEQITKIIEEDVGRQEAYKMALKARLYDILVILVRNVPMLSCSTQERNRHLNRLGRLENVFRYIEQNYSSDITLSEIASVANFSEYYFTRFF